MAIGTRLAGVIAGASVGLLANASKAQPLFDVERAAPARVFVYFERPVADAGPKPGPGAEPTAKRALPVASPLSSVKPWPEMAQRLMGGVELTKEQIAALRRSPGVVANAKKDKAEAEGQAGIWATVVLGSAKGEETIVEVTRGPHAEFFASRDGLPPVPPAANSVAKRRELKSDIFAPLAAGWNVYCGPWDKPMAPLEIGKTVEIPVAMRTPSVWWLDERTLGSRGLLGTRVQVVAATRDLSESTMFVRVPKGYSPKTPVGLLVWIDPSPVGDPPQMLEKACDELGLAVVGVSMAGNTRPPGDRTQLTLDAAATVMRLVHVDQARVYATGLSGGGRMSSVMVSCFPDLFTGSVSMAGIGHFRDQQTPEGKIWPAYFQKPSGTRWTMLMEHRQAAITGPLDFNHVQTLATVAAMEKEKLTVREWTIPGLGHEFPTAEQYAEVVRWVDKPGRTAAAKREEEGAKMWAVFEALPAGEMDEARRAMLLEIVEKSPWTVGAWKAAGKLDLIGGERPSTP